LSMFPGGERRARVGDGDLTLHKVYAEWKGCG
jgi:hypothetical protein